MAAKKKKAAKFAKKKAASKPAKPKNAKAKKAPPRKATAKQGTAKKKKAAPKPSAPKKAASKQPSAKQPAPKKAARKEAAPDQPAPKKAARKEAAPGQPALKQAAKRAPQTTPRKAAATTRPVDAAVVPKPIKRVPSGPPDPTVQLAQAVAALALDKKAEDVVILKVTDLTSYADCFILASAPSERQVQSIARHVADEMKKAGKAPMGTEGLEQGHWVLVDLGAIVLHVFLASARRYYDLEGFWSDAPRVDVDEAQGLAVVAKMTATREAANAPVGDAADSEDAAPSEDASASEPAAAHEA